MRARGIELALVLALAGCGSSEDAPVAEDAAPEDSGTLADDSSLADSSLGDGATEDSSLAETSSEDSSPLDSTIEETSADTSTVDTYVLDTATTDTGSDTADTTVVDSSAPDTAIDTAVDTAMDTAETAPPIVGCGPAGATTGWVDNIDVTGAPITITGAETAVWIGTGLFVFDGGTFARAHRGAIWNRSTRTWKAINVASAPQSLAGFGLAWTGSRVVLFGGRTTAGTVVALNSGYLYDPVADTWSTMTAPSPPSARNLPWMTWNGSRVVVWGGSAETSASPSGFLVDGGLWDPVANTWTAIPGVGAGSPLPNNPGTAAAWTNTGLFVAGRWSSAGYFDHWTSGAWPAACSFPLPTIGNQWGTVVWTGSEAIWWGGVANSGPPGYTDSYFRVGFRTTPGSCTVTSIPITASSPTARAHHSAVWTGSRMIVFGGRTASTTFADGFSYDPVTGSWMPLEAGTPGQRADHRAFWTGTEMVVWGSAPSADRVGCIYRP